MNRLVRVELTRLWWRRLPIVGALALLAVTGIALFGVNQTVSSAAQAIAGLDEDFNAAVADWEANGEQMLAECRTQEETDRVASGDPTLDYGCSSMGPPTIQDWFGQPPSVHGQVEELLLGLSWILLFAVLVIGCSATAKEATQRTLGTWLTFVPRRGQVYVSKLLAPALWSLPLTVLLHVLVVLGSFVVLRLHGVPDGVTTAQWSDLGWLALRLLLLGAVVAAVGAAAGFVLRNAAVLIGLVVGYVIAVESILAQLVGSLQRWTVSRNVTAWVADGTTWTDVSRCDEFGCTEVQRSLDLAQAAAYLGGVAALVVLVGYLTLRLRDLD